MIGLPIRRPNGLLRRWEDPVAGVTSLRVIPLPCKVDADKVSASMKRGVLKVNFPKLPGEELSKGKRIEIKAS